MNQISSACEDLLSKKINYHIEIKSGTDNEQGIWTYWLLYQIDVSKDYIEYIQYY